MLNIKQRTVLEAYCVVDGKSICQFTASINSEDPNNMTLTSSQMDKVACKTHRDVVRDDRAEFEDYAYSFQDEIIAEKQANTEATETTTN